MTNATVVYSGRTTNWPVIALTAGAAIALAVLGRPWDGPWPGMATPVAIFVIALVIGLIPSTSMRVTAGPRGVQIYCGVFGWPRFTYSREQIADADIVEVSAWQSWYWTPSGGWHFFLRSGPAIRLTLRSGRHVTVGVTDADAALSALGLTPVNRG